MIRDKTEVIVSSQNDQHYIKKTRAISLLWYHHKTECQLSGLMNDKNCNLTPS